MYDKDFRNDEDMKRTLIEKAIAALPNSYAPYSKYNVAAAVLMSTGNIYTGVNVENAGFSATVCAERNAIHHAIAEGEKEIVAIAVVGGTNAEIGGDYCVPCGICRQVMREFADKDKMIILCAKSADDYLEKTLDEMLPYSFGPERLNMQVEL